MFRRRRGKRRGSYGGSLKFHTRFKGGNKVTQVPTSQEYFTKHPFYQTLNQTTEPAFDVVPYTMSALFDMDGAGADAGYAARMNLFWKNYVVIGCAWRVTCVNLEATTSLTLMVVPWSSTDVPTSLADMEYRAGCKTVIVSPMGSAGDVKTLSGYVNIAQMFGMKIWNEEEFFGVDTANPTRNTFLYIALQDNVALAKDYQLRTHLQLYVKWFNRVDAGEPALAAGGFKIGDTISALRKKADALEAHIPMVCDVVEEEKKGSSVVV